MKKRSLAVLMAGVMAASMMTGVVSVYADADSKTLTVGFDAEYPPFGYKDDNGEYVGFDLDLAQEVCDNLGWELVKKPINWDSKDMELNSGSIDCIWNGFTINGREDDYTWSDPYLNNEQVMVVAADSGIEKLDDLAGRNVVVQAASAALDALNSDDNKDLTASFASLTENPDYNTAFMNLDSGAADAIAVDIGVAKYQLSQREEGKYKILDEPIQSEQYGIGFAKGNEELRDTVWAEVMKLHDEGEIDKRVRETAKLVGIDDSLLNKSPFELSGGMQQRVGIAAAMLLNPCILLADEPTSALDVTTQAQIVGEMARLRRDYGTAILLVTHNLGVAAYLSDRILVMRQGKIEEAGDRDTILRASSNAYTRSLLESVPTMGGVRYV